MKISLFLDSSDLGFNRIFFCSFLLIFFPMYLDPWIRKFFSDSDPGGQNSAGHPDPKQGLWISAT